MDNKGNHPQLALFQVSESLILFITYYTNIYLYTCSCSRLIHNSPSIHPAFRNRGQFALQWRLGSHAQALDVWLFTVLWLCDAQHRLRAAPWRARMDRSPQELWPFCWGKHGKTHTHIYNYIYMYYVYVWLCIWTYYEAWNSGFWRIFCLDKAQLDFSSSDEEDKGFIQDKAIPSYPIRTFGLGSNNCSHTAAIWGKVSCWVFGWMHSTMSQFLQIWQTSCTQIVPLKVHES